MITSVMEAFLASGRRNAGTPLEIASMPVRATAPDEKARRNSSSVSRRQLRAADELVQRLLIGRQRVEMARHDPYQADGQHRPEDDDVHVGGAGEQAAGLLHAPQVGDRHEGDEAQADRDPLGPQLGERRGDGRHAGRHRHRDGQDVVDEQRGAGHEGRHLAEVVAAHDVRAAAARVGVDRLAVAGDHQHEQHHDDDRDGHELVERDGEARRGARARAGSPRSRTRSRRWRRRRRRRVPSACPVVGGAPQRSPAVSRRRGA